MSKAAMEMALKALERWQENVYINPHTLAKETISAIAAIKEAIKQAKREALLEAARVCEGMSTDETWAYIECSEAIDHMAEELK